MKQLCRAFIILILLSPIQQKSYSQVSYVGNDGSAPLGSYLGWDFTRDLDFRTNDILRMILLQTQTSTINGYPGIVQDGFLGLSDGPAKPFRQWMLPAERSEAYS
jgi:hypothetical protein